ncbi:MAG: ketopantoate reductase family protein [Microbacteriaceae bacterium]
MRLAVIGAGAVGGTLAALASRAGHDVTVVARGEHSTAIERHGLSVAGAFGQSTSNPRVAQTISAGQKFDLVIVAVKAHQTASALGGNDISAGTPILVVQNGLGGFDVVREYFPENPAAIGLALFGATIVEPGRVNVTYAASLVVGGDSAACKATKSILGAHLRVRLARHPEGAVWTKLVINAVNAVPAMTGLSVQRTIAHPMLRRIVTALMRETARIGFARGEKFADLGAVSAADVRFIALAPLFLSQIIPLRLAAKMGDVPNFASTMHSIRRGRTTEVDFLSGAVVQEAAAINRDAPVNRTVTELIHEVERTGVFMEPDEVIDRVPLV